MNTSRENQQQPSFATDLQFIFDVLWSKAWLIALCVTAAVALSLFYIFSSPKVYAAKAVIQIEQEEQRILKIEGLRSEDLKSLDVLKTYEQSITSPGVLLRVIHHPAVRNDPGFLPEVKQRSDNLLQETLAKHIEAKIRRGTRLIDIKVEDQNPQLAQRIATLLIDEFDRWNFESRREAGHSAREFLLEETDRLKAQLTKSERALQNYKEQNEAVSLDDKQNITVEKLKDLNLRVTLAKAERLKLESDAAQLAAMGLHSPTQLLALPSVASAQNVVDLRKSLGESEARLATVSKRYLPGHPKFIQARGELENGRSALDAAILKAAGVLTSQHDAAVLTEQKLEAALREQQKLALAFDKLSMSYAVLVRDAESDRELYNSVLTRLKETDVTKNITQDSVRAIARPLLPDRPVKPRKSLALALSVMAGLASGCGLAFASHAANRSLRTLEDAEARLGLPSLSEIPKLPPPKRRSKRSPLQLESDPAAAESFRTLRTSLLLIGHDAAAKTFLFTSAHPAEGKTFCAINCAVSFAQLGFKTLLVDADLRRPRIDKVFVDSSPLRRTGEPMHSEAAWHEALQETEIPNLSLLSAEKLGLEAAASFSEPGFAQFLQRATAEFDRVVLDSAPVHLVSDTLLFAKHVEAVCLVIHAGRTSAQDALRAAKRLSQAGAPLVGFVWNRTKARHGYYYERAAAAGGRGAKHGRGRCWVSSRTCALEFRRTATTATLRRLGEAAERPLCRKVRERSARRACVQQPIEVQSAPQSHTELVRRISTAATRCGSLHTHFSGDAEHAGISTVALTSSPGTILDGAGLLFRASRAVLLGVLFLIYAGALVYFNGISPLLLNGTYAVIAGCIAACVCLDWAVSRNARSVAPYLVWLGVYFLWGMIASSDGVVAREGVKMLIKNVLVLGAVAIALERETLRGFSRLVQIAALGNFALCVWQTQHPELIAEIAQTREAGTTAFNVLRPAGLWSNPDESASAFVFALLLGPWAGGALAWAGRVAAIGGIFLSASRTGAYMLVICALLGAWHWMHTRRLNSTRLAAFCAAVLLACAGTAAVARYANFDLSSYWQLSRMLDFTEETRDVDHDSRAEIALSAVRTAIEGPWFGNGLFTFQGEPTLPTLIDPPAHNMFLVVWGETGALVAVAYVALLAIGLWRVVRLPMLERDRMLLLAIWFCYLLIGLTWHNQFTAFAGMLYTALLWHLPAVLGTTSTASDNDSRAAIP